MFVEGLFARMSICLSVIQDYFRGNDWILLILYVGKV